MATVVLRSFGPIYRYRGSLTIGVYQPTRGERVLVLSGTIGDGVYTLHVEGAQIRVPTVRVEEDDDGPFAVVEEQRVPIPGGRADRLGALQKDVEHGLTLPYAPFLTIMLCLVAAGDGR